MRPRPGHQLSGAVGCRHSASLHLHIVGGYYPLLYCAVLNTDKTEQPYFRIRSSQGAGNSRYENVLLEAAVSGQDSNKADPFEGFEEAIKNSEVITIKKVLSYCHLSYAQNHTLTLLF